MTDVGTIEHVIRERAEQKVRDALRNAAAQFSWTLADYGFTKGNVVIVDGRPHEVVTLIETIALDAIKAAVPAAGHLAASQFASKLLQVKDVDALIAAVEKPRIVDEDVVSTAAGGSSANP